jgi:hypothetical protein
MGLPRWAARAAGFASMAALLTLEVPVFAPRDAALPAALQPFRPVWLQAANALLAWPTQQLLSFEPDALILWSQRVSGASDASVSALDTGFHEGLGELARSMAREADLSGLGRVIAWAQLTTIVGNRLRLEDYLRSHPAAAAERVVAPVVITGLPRSGTTLLHNLMMQDDGNFRAPLNWETQDPVPPTDPGLGDADSSRYWRILRVRAQVAFFKVLAPFVMQVHNVDALNAEECVQIFALEARSIFPPTIFRLPSYMAWLLRQERPMAFHRRYLQMLQSAAPRKRTWLLKSPEHLLTLDGLWAEYPDAVVIMTHREPAGILASLSSLSARFHGVVSDRVRPLEWGPAHAKVWEQALESTMDARARRAAATAAAGAAGPAAAGLVDVQFRDLAARPLQVVKDIYKALKLELSPAALAKMQAYLAGESGDGHGKRNQGGTHEYDPAWFGLGDANMRGFDAFKRYTAMFNLSNAFKHSSEF